jgi:ubiquinol-cytochrome c reductase cytochrome c subunit
MMKALVVLFFACCALLLPSVVRADRAADHGKQLFLANNCYLCHGTVGQGGAAGPTIAPPKLPPTYEAFAAWVRKTGPGVMPVYTAKVLSDADLAAIYGYLKSLSPATSIPAVLTHP